MTNCEVGVATLVGSRLPTIAKPVPSRNSTTCAACSGRPAVSYWKRKIRPDDTFNRSASMLVFAPGLAVPTLIDPPGVTQARTSLVPRWTSRAVGRPEVISQFEAIAATGTSAAGINDRQASVNAVLLYAFMDLFLLIVFPWRRPRNAHPFTKARTGPPCPVRGVDVSRTVSCGRSFRRTAWGVGDSAIGFNARALRQRPCQRSCATRPVTAITPCTDRRCTDSAEGR